MIKLDSGNVLLKPSQRKQLMAWLRRSLKLGQRLGNFVLTITMWRSGRQFELRAEQVDAQRAMAERSFSREYQTALERVRRVHQQISMGQAQVDLSAENLRLSRLRYEGGEGLALDLVAAQNQLAQARTNYYTAVANYLNARADLEVAAGK